MVPMAVQAVALPAQQAQQRAQEYQVKDLLAVQLPVGQEYFKLLVVVALALLVEMEMEQREQA